MYMDETRQWKSRECSNDGLCGCVKKHNRMVGGCESIERGREGRGTSDHFIVAGKLTVGTRWMKTRRIMGQVKKESYELNKKEKMKNTSR